MSLASVLKSSGMSPKLKKYTTQDFDLLVETKKKLTTERIREPHKPGDNFWPSRMYELCPRKEVLRSLNNIQETETISHNLQMTFDVGNAFHQWAQDNWFGKWGWLKGHWHCLACGKSYHNCLRPKTCHDGCKAESEFRYQEMKFHGPEGYPISAKPDGIIVSPYDGAEWLLELKTSNGQAFRYITNQRRNALESHKYQTNIYMWLAQIPRGIIVYFDKDESLITQYVQRFDKILIEDVRSKIQSVKNGLDTKILPPRTACDTSKCKKAKECSVSSLCFAEV